MKIITICLTLLISIQGAVEPLPVLVVIPLAVLARLAPIIAKFTISKVALATLGLASLGAVGVGLGIIIVNVIQAHKLKKEIAGNHFRILRASNLNRFS